MKKNSKKTELKEEELEKVSGGTTRIDSCEYFLPVSGKKSTGKCKDCFYYHKSSGCSIPNK